jgi:hypothetical protein
MLVDLPRLREPAVEPLRDLARAIRVTGEEDQRGEVAGLGADVDLRHPR